MLAFLVLASCSMTYGSLVAMALGTKPPAEASLSVSASSFLAGMGGSTLPAIMGWLVDLTHSFGPGFALLAALSLLAIICLVLFPPRPTGLWAAGASDAPVREHGIESAEV